MAEYLQDPEDVNHDNEFQDWMAEVDSIIQSLVGFTSRDLPDAPWRDYFEDEMPAREAVLTANDDGWLEIPEDMMEPLYG